MTNLDSPGIAYPVSFSPSILTSVKETEGVNINTYKTTISTFRYSPLWITNDEQIIKYRIDSRPKPTKRMQKVKMFSPDF